MSRIAIPARESVPAASAPLLDAVEKQLGLVPNMFKVVALSPSVLQGFLGFSGALSKTLDVQTRERIALAVAQVNSCDYCLSAHTYLALNLAKMEHAEIALNRKGKSSDLKANAAVMFATAIAKNHGHVSDDDLKAVKAGGYSDAQIVEIVAIVAENVFTNYMNVVAQTDIDFPAQSTAEAA